jgi:hypothetical protein
VEGSGSAFIKHAKPNLDYWIESLKQFLPSKNKKPDRNIGLFYCSAGYYRISKIAIPKWA